MWADRIVGWGVILAAIVIVAGLVVRRRAGVCRTFVPYIAVVALADALIVAWPDTFHRQWFWFGKELVVHVLRFGIALELTYRAFRAFPAARASARGVLLLVLIVTLGIVFVSTGNLDPPDGAPTLGPLIVRVQPRVLNGSIWLLTAIAALILWYRLPVHPFQKALLVGFVPYLFVFSLSLNLIESWGWGARFPLSLSATLAYLLVVWYWAVAAWRRAEAPVQAPPLPSDPTLDRVPS